MCDRPCQVLIASKRGTAVSPTKCKKIDFLEATSVKTMFLDIKKRRSSHDIQLRRMIYMAVCVKKKLDNTTDQAAS